MIQNKDGSRFQQKRKERQKSMILSLAIGIVLVLAATVAYQLFSSSSEPAAKQPETEKKEVKEVKSKKNKENGDTNEEQANKEEAVQPETPKDEKVVVTDQQESGVIEAYTNPSWQPIGTSQSEPHTTQFSKSSQDWREMTQTLAYAIERNEQDFTILFLGNDGVNKAVGTIMTKDKQKYKVHIEWIEGQGWKPTLVQQLN
ncbi:YrrS family protein [Bacillus sp. 165]|uniref:YrrS family protein n=1 Tax=Bacillus sp. 165 TaxID=1529117 RepID=UPI001ADC53A9|nr:YrrS family protein [Bacillus sp. 165]MBO9130443.1 YrrS family protein [Bacillus sp. 165]